MPAAMAAARPRQRRSEGTERAAPSPRPCERWSTGRVGRPQVSHSSLARVVPRTAQCSVLARSKISIGRSRLRPRRCELRSACSSGLPSSPGSLASRWTLETAADPELAVPAGRVTNTGKLLILDLAWTRHSNRWSWVGNDKGEPPLSTRSGHLIGRYQTPSQPTSCRSPASCATRATACAKSRQGWLFARSARRAAARGPLTQ